MTVAQVRGAHAPRVLAWRLAIADLDRSEVISAGCQNRHVRARALPRKGRWSHRTAAQDEFSACEALQTDATSQPAGTSYSRRASLNGPPGHGRVVFLSRIVENPLHVHPLLTVRILFVEDQSGTRKVMTRLLHRWGFEVETANTLKSGLEHVEKKPFDVILSDIALPDGTG